MDEMFTKSITLSITYCLYPSRFSAYLLAESGFFMHVIRDKDESFRDKACIWL